MTVDNTTDQYDRAGAASQFVPQDAFPITPDDDVALPRPIRGIRATNAGDVVVITGAAVQRTLAFLAGETRYIYVTKVLASGTTASGLEGLV